MTALIGGVLLAAGVVLYILEPVLSGKGAPLYSGDDDYDESAARRRIALTALRDLEYDLATGKLDDDDYELLKAELSREALSQLGPEARDGEVRDPARERVSRELEDEIAQLRQALREGLQCTACQHLNSLGARFCGRCGEVLGVAAGPAEGGGP